MAVSIEQLLADLDAETRVFRSWIDPLPDADWSRPTPAVGWTIADQVSHLAYFDDMAVLAATDPDAFRAGLAEAVADVDGFTARIAAENRARTPAQLRDWFASARTALLATFATVDPKARLPWYGPDMSVASSLTARIMETWAHGQDVFDALGEAHPATRALKQVAYLGVRTVPNSFVTRGLDVPDAPIFVALHAPDGERWEWGDASAENRVEGDAVEFCGVVTQRRNVADTSLAISGAVATQWMQIAQAFAGPPGEGRPPRS